MTGSQPFLPQQYFHSVLVHKFIPLCMPMNSQYWQTSVPKTRRGTCRANHFECLASYTVFFFITIKKEQIKYYGCPCEFIKRFRNLLWMRSIHQPGEMVHNLSSKEPVAQAVSCACICRGYSQGCAAHCELTLAMLSCWISGAYVHGARWLCVFYWLICSVHRLCCL